MKNNKYILLSWIMPVIFCNILVLSWVFSSASVLIWFGLFLCPLMFLIALIGGIVFFVEYKNESKSGQKPLRFLSLAGHVLILGMGLAFSYHGFDLFKHEMIRSTSKQADITIHINNTSLEKIQHLKILLGDQTHDIPILAPRESKELKLSVGDETALSVQLTVPKEPLRETQVALNKKIEHVYLRLDMQQNIMVELY